jgi:hypothetical protein
MWWGVDLGLLVHLLIPSPDQDPWGSVNFARRDRRPLTASEIELPDRGEFDAKASAGASFHSTNCGV